MVTISQVVQKKLKDRVLLQECINSEIVSFNKIAKKLKPEIEQEMNKKVKTNSIVMAIRRNSKDLTEKSKRASFSYAIETIKTDICYIVLEESPTLLSKLQNLYPIIDFKKGGYLNIIQGNYEVAIITNKKYKEELIDHLHEERVLDTIDDLVSVSLTYSKDYLYMPGIMYDISRFLAWENINIYDIILTKTELNIIIDKKDLTKCYKTLGRFSENNK